MHFVAGAARRQNRLLSFQERLFGRRVFSKTFALGEYGGDYEKKVTVFSNFRDILASIKVPDNVVLQEWVPRGENFYDVNGLPRFTGDPELLKASQAYPIYFGQAVVLP